MPTIQPEQLANSGSEDGHQLAIMQWCALNLNTYPELKWLHHSPNGGFRNKKEAGKLKAMGVRRGFPDLFMPIGRGPYKGLAIELKAPSRRNTKNGGMETEQDDWKELLNSQWFYATTCYGWQEAVSVIKHYMELK